MNYLDLFGKNVDVKKFDKKEFHDSCPNYPYLPTILPAQKRIIVIGDIHGDYNLALESFRIANLIDDSDRWIGGKTHVVQVGDQVDRCRPIKFKCEDEEATKDDEGSDLKIINLFNSLHKQATKQGGAVISLLGNHELMNVMGNMDYVSHKGLTQFNDYKDPTDDTTTFASGKEARQHAFRPGGEYAKLLACTRLPAVIIGSFVFIHGGIVPEFLEKNKINSQDDFTKVGYAVRQWILGLINKEYVSSIVDSLKYSMFWNRILGNIPPDMNSENPQCINYLEPVLKVLKLKGMVVGHTPQFGNHGKGINGTCDDQLWRVDNGGSDAFSKFDRKHITTGHAMKEREPQVLEILDDKKFNVLK